MVKPSPDDLNAWRARQTIYGVNFAHDDLVTILAGEHAGNIGSLASIEQLEPEVVFLVEIDSGFNVAAKQSDIELVD